MADLRPFPGLRYRPQFAGDLGALLAPPFDALSPAEQRRLHELSPFNVVRLELGETLPSDTPEENQYTRARTLLDLWLREGVLAPDEEPACYLLRTRFRYRGADWTRHGLVAAVRIEEYEQRVILPHEHTTPAPKADRLALLEACAANVSPILGLYQDPSGELAALFAEVTRPSPAVRATDSRGGRHALWLISDDTSLGRIRRLLSEAQLFIGDGHHRYETALAFRDRMRAAEGRRFGPEHAANFVMMALVDLADPGLLLLPYHRAIAGLDASLLGRLRARVEDLFGVVPFARDGDDRGDEEGWVDQLLARVEGSAGSRAKLGLVGPDGQGPYLLTLREPVEGESPSWLEACEPWLLQERVLRPVLGEALARHVHCVPDPSDAAERTRRGEAQLAFLLRPVPAGLFAEVARRGLRLPPKTAYLYPQLPTGMVIRRLAGKRSS